MDERFHSESSYFAVRMLLLAGPQSCVKSVLSSSHADTKIPIFSSCITWDTVWRDTTKEGVVGSREAEEQNHSPVKN